MLFRKFISLSITFSFLVMSYTGIMLFISPKGRVANWSNWEIFGLSKTQYANLHVTFMILFLTGMLLHIYLNWKPLWSYLKNKNREFSLFTREFMFALGFTCLFFFGVLYEIAPFKQFIEFQDDVKLSWEKSENTPIYGHAELSTLKEFTINMNIDTQEAIVLLKNKGYVDISADAKLIDIAKENAISPNDIYISLNSKVAIKKATATAQQGSGFGQMSLVQVSEKYGIDIEKSISILKEKGIKVDKDSKMKELANQLEVTPFDLLEMIR